MLTCLIHNRPKAEVDLTQARFHETAHFGN
jgi:hypothetical protein